MQNYGPRDHDVRKYLASLQALTYESWHAARMQIVGTVVDLYKKYDDARLMLTIMEQRYPTIDEAADAAKAAARAEITQVPWSAEHPEVIRDAEDGARAIISMDVIDFDELAILFSPFWRTNVIVPVTWNQ